LDKERATPRLHPRARSEAPTHETLDRERGGSASDHAYPLEREGCLHQWLDRQPQKHERIVVPRGPIEMKLIATGTAVDEDPLPVPAHGDGDRLHQRTALRGAISRAVVIEVPAPQACRTVIPVSGTGSVRRDVQPTVAASERIWAAAMSAATLIA
jgi:hypothetical protein